MDANELLERLKGEPDIDSSSYDGSYEVMRATVDAYSTVTDWDVIDYTDLDLIYLMAVGTFSDGLEKKKNRVRNSHLPENAKSKLLDTLDDVWGKVCRNYYSNANDPYKDKDKKGPWFGMFGTGFYSFSKNVSEEWTKQIRELIKMLVDIRDMEDDEEIYSRAEKILNYPIKGLKAASISIMLHCLKPDVFPILNGNEGYGNCFGLLGIGLTHEKVAETYIGNCRKIKQYRDTYLSFKNYRVFDLVAKELGKADRMDLWPSLEEYPTVLTTDQWIEFLEEDKKTYPETFKMLKCMERLGGEATCKKLSQVLGGSPTAYIRRGTGLGTRVKKAYNLPPCMDGDIERLFPIPFQGHRVKNIDENNILYSWVLRNELKEALDVFDDEEEEMKVKTDIPLNTILYGPPGTGKTYSTIKYAVSICDPDYAAKHEEYADYLARFNELKSEGRIAFTTFHQSYGYEEFIEGIKPVVSSEESSDAGNAGIEYSIESGVFKKFCEKAAIPTSNNTKDYGFNENPTVWKVSLYGSGDNAVRSECLGQGHIRIGWDEYGPDISEERKFEDGGRGPLDAFINRMQEGDIIFSCYSQSMIDAIGVVIGDYEWVDSYHEYKRVRKVNWILKKKIDIRKLNGGRIMVQSTVYRMSITAGDVIRLINSELSPGDASISVQNDEKYVFIIDEINRGNISKILGELITLIEESKRIGNVEEMRAILPYSHKEFGVPNNVYILGTMNTADRSIALMDTALRRRFHFEEMMPDSSVIDGLMISANGENLDVAAMLNTINERIEYLYDREHTIGHAFFTGLKENPTLQGLAEVFRTSVVPLLQEYFYEDYEKIQLVLGDNSKSSDDYKFILDSKADERVIFKGIPELDLKEKKYKIQEEAFDRIQSYIEISETRRETQIESAD